MSATDTSEEAADAPAARRRRPLRRALALCVGGLALGGLLLAALPASHAKPLVALSAATPERSASASRGSASIAPNVPAPLHAHRAAKVAISLFTATPAQVPAAGGTVRLIGVVQGAAASCHFAATKPLAHLPASRACGSGSVSLTIKLPRNTGSSARRFRFTMTAVGTASRMTAGPVSVLETATPAAGSAPKVTLQPTGRTVVAGTKVTFTAAASGSRHVQWQRSGDSGGHWSNVPGATSGSYSFAPTVADSGSEFRALFTNAAGTTHSAPATLAVTGPGATAGPVVTQEPSSLSVVAGSGVTFTAAASGSPAPSVQWQVSTDGGATWSAIAGSTSASYTLTAQLGLNADEYRAVFTNSLGSATTTPATLTVSSSPLTVSSSAQSPALSTQPASQSIVLGQSATFSAQATGSPAPTVAWQQSTNGGTSWSPVAGATSTTLTVTPSSTGVISYEAVFTNSAGAATSAAATLTVTATQVPPSVTQQPLSQTGVSGQSTTFVAAASGSPTPSVSWQVSTNSGGTWSAVVPAATLASYTFTVSQGESGWQYRAVFTNSAGSAITNAATLTVQTAPQITLSPSNVSTTAGSQVSFSATASGTPTPTVQWQLSTNSGASWSPISGATAATYSFIAQTGQSGDLYRALFSNSAGSTPSDPASLSVAQGSTGPVVLTNPSSQAVPAGVTVDLTASASGAPTPTVQWWVSINGGSTWSAVAGATQTTYQFTASGSENNYEYEAVFTNSVSSATSNAATLNVGPNGEATSRNWSGYVSTSGTFSAVAGSWNVPSATCPGATTYSSEWVGIDGYTSGTVEQDGTDSDCNGTNPTYYAWYETYGAQSTDPPLNNGNSVSLSTGTYPVSAGDSMTATVSVVATTYTLAITDNSKGWSFSIPVVWSVPTRSSAEWVVERPSVGGQLASLTNFGVTGFSGATASTGGSPESISALGGFGVEMTNNAVSTMLALPGSLTSGGQSFNDTFYGSS